MQWKSFCCQTTIENDLCVIVLVQTLCALLFIWLFIYLKAEYLPTARLNAASIHHVSDATLTSFVQCAQ